MDALIRAAVMAPEVRKLGRREGAAPGGAVVPEHTPIAVARPVVESSQPVYDVEAQRQWQRNAEQELSDARRLQEREGFAAGHAQALAEVQAASKEKLERLDALVEAAGASFTAQVDGLEDIAVAIAFEAVAKVLGKALVTREGVAAAVGQVIARAREDEKLVVRLAAGDFYLLLQDSSSPPPHFARPGIELMPDERLPPGGCVVETSSGSLDGRLESQLTTLKELLVAARTDGRRRA